MKSNRPVTLRCECGEVFGAVSEGRYYFNDEKTEGKDAPFFDKYWMWAQGNIKVTCKCGNTMEIELERTEPK